jgi:hypothetical protein
MRLKPLGHPSRREDFTIGQNPIAATMKRREKESKVPKAAAAAHSSSAVNVGSLGIIQTL